MAAERAVGADLAALPDGRREIAEAVRRLVRSAAPEAREAFTWAQPVFESGGQSLRPQKRWPVVAEPRGFEPRTSAVRPDVDPQALQGKGVRDATAIAIFRALSKRQPGRPLTG
jgi:hypothetical protein